MIDGEEAALIAPPMLARQSSLYDGRGSIMPRSRRPSTERGCVADQAGFGLLRLRQFEARYFSLSIFLEAAEGDARRRSDVLPRHHDERPLPSHAACAEFIVAATPGPIDACLISRLCFAFVIYFPLRPAFI